MRIMICAVVLLAACAPMPTAQQYQAFEASIPTCTTAKGCEVKWATARRWVLDNAGFKIQHMTDDFIETYNSTDYTSTDLWARISKEPVDGDTYRILIEVGCNNMFGCHPEAMFAKQSFNDYVNKFGAIKE